MQIECRKSLMEFDEDSRILNDGRIKTCLNKRVYKCDQLIQLAVI